MLDAVKSLAEADTVMAALNEQNVYGAEDNADFTFVEMNETTDMFFNSMIEETTCVEQERDTVPPTWNPHEQAPPAISDVVPERALCVSPKPKKRVESKPRSIRRRSVLQRLEEVRKRARKGLPMK